MVRFKAMPPRGGTESVHLPFPATVIRAMTDAWIKPMKARRITLTLVLVAASSGFAAAATVPPVDCRHDRKVVGRTICASPELTAIDKEIAALNDRGAAQFGSGDQQRLAQSQLSFFRRRNGCAWASHNSAHPGTAVAECIGAAMEDRLHSLRAIVDRGHY